MFVTADQLVAHAVGDYLLQSDWMAQEKTKRSVAAACHALVYTLGFLFLTRSVAALAFVAGTHFVVDRWRLARYVCWAKNWIGIRVSCTDCDRDGTEQHETHFLPVNLPWAQCRATGYAPDRPAWLAVWLMIIADNTIHVILNAFALRYLA